MVASSFAGHECADWWHFHRSTCGCPATTSLSYSYTHRSRQYLRSFEFKDSSKRLPRAGWDLDISPTTNTLCHPSGPPAALTHSLKGPCLAIEEEEVHAGWRNVAIESSKACSSASFVGYTMRLGLILLRRRSPQRRCPYHTLLGCSSSRQPAPRPENACKGRLETR